ncbi:MAG: aminopeptidase P family protein [Treponema sp.]|jgi:Xaa-Pro aminopeptidase|nr:aminopeptidase P family protein [Treponema sp.]
MDNEKVREMQKAIREENLDGWLFCNFRHRDALSDEILSVPKGASNSRLWIYAVPALSPPGEHEGEECAGKLPRKIVSRVEEGVLDFLPGEKVPYTGREELLSRLAALGGKRWGVHYSKTLAAISWLDAGTAALLEDAGLTLVSAAGLIQRFRGLLDGEGMASHERAAAHLYETVSAAWETVRRACRQKRTITEADIQRFFLDEFERRKLTADHPPLVAAGINSGNPHYEIRESAAFRPGDVIQFDIWAKEPDGIYADISWIGFYGSRPPAGLEKKFGDLVSAREGALDFIRNELEAGRRPSGASVDAFVRKHLAGLGYERALRHRTGHGIDTEVHGSGANIDSVEFPDERLLLDGSCFSLEPGIYFPDCGLRTEINVYIKNGREVISGMDAGHERQFRMLTCDE